MITAIEAQKRNKDKVNLYLDGEFACSLTAESVVRARLKIGQELSEERLREILATSETELAFKKALDYISRAMKTEKQVKDYLCLKGFDALAAERAVEKLKEYKYVDDLQFAALYVEMNGRQKGARRIKAELMQKGIDETKAEQALLMLSEERSSESAAALADKFMRGKANDFKNLVRLSRFLAARGFDYETINQIVDVNRIERLLKYNPTFLDSLFCAEEKEYFALRGNNPETIAEFLSLKEAALKALDAREKSDGYSLVEVRVLPNGRHGLVLKGEFKDKKVSASIFHTENNAVAVAETAEN